MTYRIDKSNLILIYDLVTPPSYASQRVCRFENRPHHRQSNIIRNITALMASSQGGDSLLLKNELKIWEKQFAADNEGRKPSREDIKANANIAAKYKQYNDLRKPPKEPRAEYGQFTPSRKRRAECIPQATPKRQTITSDEQTHVQYNPEAAEQGEVGQENASPSKQLFCAVIGPTPHKDGRVLGLFDYMPSLTPQKEVRTALGEMSANLRQTPNKQAGKTSIPMSASPVKMSRTPQSSGKRFMLDSFITPSKRRCFDVATPSSTKHLQTPSFLRRCAQEMDNVHEEPSPQKVQPFKRRSFGRSLSSMIREMKQQQDKDMDEELELLHEMEADGCPPRLSKQVEKVEQTQFDISGFDEDAFAALEDAERQERGDEREKDPEPKVWKKKGMKRQTRRVIMRPVRVKPASNEKNMTPLEPPAGAADDSDAAGMSESEENVSDFEAPEAVIASKEISKHVKSASTQASSGPKAPRRINPNATTHANFRSLKIKNKNSKSKGRGRFGNGRR